MKLTLGEQGDWHMGTLRSIFVNLKLSQNKIKSKI